jgi:hypothetical protein
MRKMVLEIVPNPGTWGDKEGIFEVLESYEVLETLKIDYEKAMYVDLIDCHLREGKTIDDLGAVGRIEVLGVLKSEGDRCTCLIRDQVSEREPGSYKDLDLDLIWTRPSIISKDKITVSCLGAHENQLRFIRIVKEHVGTITNITFLKGVYQNQDLLKVLTDKQRKVLTAANLYGYYDNPRRINGNELAKKMGSSKSTLMQHLSKAEGRIMANIFAGILTKPDEED